MKPLAQHPPALADREGARYGEPLSGRARLVVLAAVVFFHVGGAWALISIDPSKIEVGEQSALEVRLVAADQPPSLETPALPEDTPPPEFEPVKLETPPPLDTPPPEPEPVTLETPPPQDTPPPDVPLLEAAVATPTPDLPPPEFPAAAKPPPPEPPKPRPPPPPRPRPQAPVENAPQTTQPAAAAAPKVVQASEVRYINPPNLVYPARANRAREQGSVEVQFVVDTVGRPTRVTVIRSSGNADLDEAALRAMRAAMCRPYMENGLPRAILVTQSFHFVLPK